MSGRRVDLEAAGQAAPERKLLGLAPGQVVPSGPEEYQAAAQEALSLVGLPGLEPGTSSLSGMFAGCVHAGERDTACSAVG